MNITVEGGKSVRLKTKGKCCDRDIVVTAEGGAEDLNDVLTEQEALIAELQAILKVRASDDDYTAETWTFTLEDGTTLEKVVVLSV
jgi:hypothetical protein